LEALEETIRGAVDDAERSCEEKVDRILVAINGSLLHTLPLSVHVSPLALTVSAEDVKRLFLDARKGHNEEGMRTLHALPVSYSLDGEGNIENPVGMLGEVLTGTFNVVTAPTSRLKNFLLGIQASHLEPIALVAAPYASGLAVLTDDELALGATVIDMGAGGTNFAVFGSGQLIHAGFVPLGGHHVTRDLAHGLETSLFHAERLKVLHGACFSTPRDHQELIRVPCVADGPHASQTVTRSTLVDMIHPRIEEIFDHLKKKLFADSRVPSSPLQRLVLTGGGSQLPGVREVALTHLAKSVRLGRPPSLEGLEVSDRPEFATISGLLTYTQSQEFNLLAGFLGGSGKKHTFFNQVTSWFKENL
jgi:cell division protein FtsA